MRPGPQGLPLLCKVRILAAAWLEKLAVRMHAGQYNHMSLWLFRQGRAPPHRSGSLHGSQW